MVIGDFNNVTGQSEKSGGKPITFNDVKDFNDMIAKIDLVDGGYSAKKFTWCNNRLGKSSILERIDRQCWIIFGSIISLQPLPTTTDTVLIIVPF